MDVQSFVWNSENQSVSWTYNGKSIMERFENAYFASLSTQNNYVIVEAGKNYSQDQVYYLSFDGKHLFTIDKVNDRVSWQIDDQFVKINCKHILNAQFYIGQSIVMIISVENSIGKVMKGFALDGTLLFCKQSPEGFEFNYLSKINNKPSVVCDGDSTNTDAYGRSSWHFIINPITGDMSKGNLAY